MATDGNIIGITHTAEEINRQHDIYGPTVKSIRGKMVNKKVRNVVDAGDMFLKK